MLLLGIDIGTSSVKVSVIDASTQVSIASALYPESEAEIIAPVPGWAEQSPDQWWEYVKQAILKCHATASYEPKDIAAIGIAYQMHGLVLIDKDQHVLRNSIIWCDSRAIETGEKAFHEIGEEKCLTHLLNSPGNFTASKLAWVKENEPGVYAKAYKMMLPGDFIAMKFTGEVTTTSSALSEAILWDFKNNTISNDVMEYFELASSLIPTVKPLFTSHGYLKESVASRLSLKTGIPVSYKAGDQLNNALSLNVLQPGEVAATAGTSGVIYGVSDELCFDRKSRINSFAHLNHSIDQKRIGVLLCINGVGIFNRWMKNLAGVNWSYEGLNEAAAKVSPGAGGMMALPFGNGAERMFENRIIGGHFLNLDLNKHTLAHMARAVQEGIAFSFRYGLDIMRENGIDPMVIRAGKSNLFRSDVFSGSFANANNVAVEFYEGDGSYGAAIGAGLGAGIYANASAAMQNRKPIETIEPKNVSQFENLYEQWKELLNDQLGKLNETSVLPLN